MSEALRLAHWLERDCATCQQRIDAAAELRRLYAENKSLTFKLKSQKAATKAAARSNQTLRELNAELVEALRLDDLMLSGANMDAKAVERSVKAALAKVEVSK
jgi:hypothetical protein